MDTKIWPQLGSLGEVIGEAKGLHGGASSGHKPQLLLHFFWNMGPAQSVLVLEVVKMQLRGPSTMP